MTASSRIARTLRGPAATILTGTVLAQTLLLLASPVLTHLYSPAAFGALAVMTSLAAVLGSVAPLSWDRALLLPRSDSVARAVVALSAASVTAVTGITAVAAFALRTWLAALFSVPELESLWWIVPTTVAAIGTQRIVTASAVRAHAFASLRKRAVVQSLGQLGVNVSLAALGPVGLLAGTAGGRLIGSVATRNAHSRRSGATSVALSARTLLLAGRSYRRFPVVTSGSTLLNSLGVQAPPLLLALSFAPAEVGLVALSTRVLASPVAMAAEAVGHGFDASASRAIRQRSGGLSRLVWRTIGRCGVGAAAIVAASVLVAPVAFDILFGSEWRQAGDVAIFIGLMAALQFVALPISRLLTMLERQRAQLIWDSARMVTVCGVITGSSAFGASLGVALFAWVVVSLLSYASLIALALRAASRCDQEFTNVIPDTGDRALASAAPPPPFPS